VSNNLVWICRVEGPGLQVYSVFSIENTESNEAKHVLHFTQVTAFFDFCWWATPRANPFVERGDNDVQIPVWESHYIPTHSKKRKRQKSQMVIITCFPQDLKCMLTCKRKRKRKNLKCMLKSCGHHFFDVKNHLN
jgi:hypothetical protein